MSIQRDKRRVPRRFLWILLLMLGAAGASGLRRGPAPTLTLEPALPAVGPSTDVTVTVAEPGRGLSPFRVLAVQGTETELASEEHEPRASWALWRSKTDRRQITVQVGSQHQPELTEGMLTLRVESSAAGTWLLPPKPVVQEIQLPVKLTPPTLDVLSDRPVVRQGGSGAVAYRAGSTAVRHGVRVGERDVEGFPLPVTETSGEREDTRTPGTSPGAGASFALYGVPHDVASASEVVLFAVDGLGNRAERSFLSRFDPRRFTSDDIRLSDGFLDDVVPEILSQTPSLTSSGDRLQDYLTINGKLRQENARRLREIARGSAAQRFWRGPFTQLPSSRVMAVFGDHRTYLYDGQAVDQQTHLGHDLASVRQAPVPASEAGEVVLAEYLGIYGQTVVLDHGYGLLTLYSHLSQIAASQGDRVDKGQTLGRTGASGLAGGDHLHFTVMVGGVMVEPLEWWDRRWLETRIEAPLGPTFAID